MNDLGALVQPPRIELGQVNDEGRGGFPLVTGQATKLCGQRVVGERGRVHHHDDDISLVRCQGGTDCVSNISIQRRAPVPERVDMSIPGTVKR